jgi:histidyl-tRNA synthetase
LMQAIDKLERESRERNAEKLGELVGPIQKILSGSGKSEKLERLVEGLRARGLADFVDVDVRIVRGLAYYTGVVFEVFDRTGEFRAIAGGGRYDNLIGQLSDGAVSLPALGFAMGDVVLGEVIERVPAAREKRDQAIRTAGNIEIYAVIAKEERRADALAQVQLLREQGYKVDYPLVAVKVAKQFQSAEQLGARVAILFGDEWPNVAVKDLASGEQQLVSNKELLAYANRLLSLSS